MRPSKRGTQVASATMYRNIAAGFIGSVVGVGVNGIFSIVLARTLDTDELGAVSALFGVISMVALACSAVQIATSRAVATNQNVSAVTEQKSTWTRQVLLLGMLGALLWPAISLQVARLLKLGYWEVASATPVFLLSAGLALEFGKIHGSNRIMAWMVLAQLGTVLKLLFVGFAILIQRSVLAVSIALTLSMAAILLSTFMVSRNIRTPPLHFLGKQFLVSFTSIGIFAILLNLDVIIARVVLEADESGQYAILSLFYKTIASILGVVGTVVFPRFASIRSTSGSVNARVRVVTLGMSVTALLLSYPIGFVGTHLIGTVVGPGYETATRSLMLAALVSIPWTGVQVAVQCRLVESTWRLTTVLSVSVIAVPMLLRLPINSAHSLVIGYGNRIVCASPVTACSHSPKI